MTIFTTALLLVALIAVLFECDVVEAGMAEGHTRAEFAAATVMELLTLLMVWLALRLFKMPRVKSALQEQRAPALANWGTLRLLLLDVPLVANMLLYELFLNSTFAYLAIVLLVCQPFVCPTMSRCEAETAPNANTEK